MFNSRRIKSALLVLTLAVSLFSLSACSGTTEDETAKPNVSLEAVTSDKLEGDIPFPKKGEVRHFSTEESNGYTVSAYVIENFSEKDAKDYIKKLKSSGFKEKHYAEVETNGYPTINFVGEREDGTGVSFSHCKSAGAVSVSVKK